MTDAEQSMLIESLKEALSATRAEAEGLRVENGELKVIVVEMQRALDAANANVRRYQELYEKGRPNQPEHVAGVEQQLVFETLLASSGLVAEPAVNDIGPGEAGDCAPPALDPPQPPPNAPPPTKRPSKGRRPHGRRGLDLTNLPVDEVVVDPPEVLAAGQNGYTLVGEETSERVAYSRARYTRLRIVRRTFRKDGSPDGAEATETAPGGAGSAECDGTAREPGTVLVTAPIPDAVWPRVMADPSAIAHVIVSKYDDLAPLHRQESITRREGFVVPRSTACGWLGPAADVLGRIVDAAFVDGKATSFCMATDATGARVRGNRAACTSWKVFVFVADSGHVVFRHSRKHDSATLAAMLAGYDGFLLGDAASIYSPLVTAGMIALVCCWAHVRRYFYKALDSDRPRALEAIAIIGKLFEVERACTAMVGAEKTARRAALAEPLLKLFDDWMDRNRSLADPRSPLMTAITYADNQRNELRRFLEDGRLRIDNNICEGQLRSLVLGLNNWQYFENEAGLRWYTTFRSLIASCKLHGLCPQRYLECVLRLAPHWSQLRMLDLSPKYWRATAARLSLEQRAIVRPPWSDAFDAFDDPTPGAQTSSPAPPSTVAA